MSDTLFTMTVRINGNTKAADNVRLAFTKGAAMIREGLSRGPVTAVVTAYEQNNEGVVTDLLALEPPHDGT